MFTRPRTPATTLPSILSGSRSSSPVARMAFSDVSIMSAVIAPAILLPAAETANSFAAPTTVGPTASTALCLLPPNSMVLKISTPRNSASRPSLLEEWFNLIFVNLDPEAGPLGESLGELPARTEKFDFKSMKFSERRTYEMNCNWKTYIDNYLEGYHLPSIHPALNREVNYNAYTVEPYAQYVRQWTPIRGAQPGDATPRRYPQSGNKNDNGDELTADYFWIFPNWMLNCYPDNISLNIILPLAPERTLAIFEWYLPEKDLGSEAARKALAFSDEIQAEDVSICEIVQKNLHSRSYHSGRYSVKQEKGVHAFHQMYREFMPA